MALPLAPLDPDVDPTTTPGHRWLEHTADLAVELWAPDEPALLLEGARALVLALTEGTELPTPDEPRQHDLTVDALDREDRLVRFLDEVLYLATVEGFLTLGGALRLREEPDGAHLEASLRGVAASDLLVQEIKAVTYHELLLIDQHDARGRPFVRARVILDV